MFTIFLQYCYTSFFNWNSNNWSSDYLWTTPLFGDFCSRGFLVIFSVLNNSAHKHCCYQEINLQVLKGLITCSLVGCFVQILGYFLHKSIV